jgi:hypothetical protein
VWRGTQRARRLPAVRRAFIVATLIASTILIALAYASAFVTGGLSWGLWCMVAGLAGISMSVTALGAFREGRRNRMMTAALWTTGVCIVAGFSLALLLPDEGTAERMILGFPARAAAVIWLVGLAPLFVFPLVYAWTFDAMTLRDEDLIAVRAARRQDDGDA